MKKNVTTTKKTKVIGTQNYINQLTGEVNEMHVINVEENSDANFHKIWLGHILSALDMLGGQKIKVLNYLLEHMNNENIVIATQRKISKDTGISAQTISTTLKALKEANVISIPQAGVYRLNPDVVFKGYSNKRMNVLIQYNSERSDLDDTTRD